MLETAPLVRRIEFDPGEVGPVDSLPDPRPRHRFRDRWFVGRGEFERDRGDRIGVLHLWNERMPVISENGPDLAWAREMARSLKYSFGLLAEYVTSDPSMTGIEAFGGDLTFVYSTGVLRVFGRLGIETRDELSASGMASRFVAAAMRIWAWLLRWAFNPASVRGKGLGVFDRRSIWLSVRRLIELHGHMEPSE